MMGEAGKEKMTWWQRQIEEYQQQESWVWRPVYTVHTMWWPFLGMGCVMFVLGLGMMSVQGNYNELEWDYTDCKCNQTDISEDIKAMDYLERERKPCKCSKEVNITKENDQAKWDRDILIYYGLENFHQNHRQYADSRDDKQLNGKRLNAAENPDIPDFDCEAPHHSANISGEVKPILPCGSIANSLFNDKVKMFFKNSSCQLQSITLLKTGIAMPFDKKRYNNPIDPKMLEGKVARPRNWTTDLWDLDNQTENNNGLENEDLIVWMRPAPLGKFRKLWRRVDHNDRKHIELKDGLHTGYMYTVEIEYNYQVSGFDGRKKVIITRANPLGAKNKMRGYIAMAAAVFFYFFSALFFLLAKAENSPTPKN